MQTYQEHHQQHGNPLLVMATTIDFTSHELKILLRFLVLNCSIPFFTIHESKNKARFLLTDIVTRSLEELNNLGQTQRKAFRNLIVTDGYTCVVYFSRAIKQANSVNLELEDFAMNEIQSLFRTCSIDPGRTDAYTTQYNHGESRTLGTHEYYSMTGSVARAKDLSNRKQQQSIQEIESAIPSVKTTDIAEYNNYTRYILENLPALFNFYNPYSARPHWKAYCGKQKAMEEAVNILINGGKKYNARKRDHHKTNNNKQWRRRTVASRRVTNNRNKENRKERRLRRIRARERNRAAADVPSARSFILDDTPFIPDQVVGTAIKLYSIYSSHL